MEGSPVQKIRTMAQDLERANQLSQQADLKTKNTQQVAQRKIDEIKQSATKDNAINSRRLAVGRPTPKTPPLPTKPPVALPQNNESIPLTPSHLRNLDRGSVKKDTPIAPDIPPQKPQESFNIEPKSHLPQSKQPTDSQAPAYPQIKDHKTLKEILDETKKRSLENYKSQQQGTSPQRSPATLSIDELLPIENSSAPKKNEPPINLPTGLPIEDSLPSQPPRPPSDIKASSPSRAQRPTPEDILDIKQHKRPIQNEKPAPVEVKKIPPTSAKTPIPSHKKSGESTTSPLKFAAIAGLLGLVAISITAGIVWRVFLYEPPPVVITPAPPGPPLPTALISYSEQREIEIEILTYDSLKPKLDSLPDLTFSPSSLTYVPIRVFNEQKNAYLTLEQLFQTLQIDAPPNLFTIEEYTLFLYTPDNTLKDFCWEKNIYSSLCYGPRLGLVLKLPQTNDLMQKTMSEWEKTITQDLAPLMLFAPDITGLRDLEFSDGRLNGVMTRYINMPVHTMSIDWILTSTHLIISTSKDSARAAFDSLTR
jgi:hypothetical protein